jgi:hypothetical protein
VVSLNQVTLLAVENLSVVDEARSNALFISDAIRRCSGITGNVGVVVEVAFIRVASAVATGNASEPTQRIVVMTALLTFGAVARAVTLQ